MARTSSPQESKPARAGNPPARRRDDAAAQTQSTSKTNTSSAAWRVSQTTRSARTLHLALLSAAALWAALPPLNLWPLAWVAPVGWLLLARQAALPGRRPYLVLWLSGFVFWLAMLHFLRYPHPATSIGWVALSAYLGCYIPVFVGLTRVAVHRWRMSLVIAGPVVWTGLELARGHLLSGFTMASLGHTQAAWLPLVQVADLAGAYGVGFVVMCGAACLARMIAWDGQRRAWWPLAPAVALVGATLAYGSWRLHDFTARPGPTVAIIQGSVETKVKADRSLLDVIHEEYMGLSRQAVAERRGLDLVIWPETMCRQSLFTIDDDATPPPGADWTVTRLRQFAQLNEDLVGEIARELGAPLLLGIDIHHLGAGIEQHFNSAIHVAADGRIIDRYDKMHPVMFGEYIPFAAWFPMLYRMSPLAAGLTSGKQAAAFDVAGFRVQPDICFENVLPHLIRRQVLELRRAGREPDVLVNLTNDGWFNGSSELDLHLLCGLFRAIECRKPMLIAANTGFSAWIDASGAIQAQGPRRDRGVIIADVKLDDRTSPYLLYGDLPAGACLLICVGLAVSGVWGWWKGRNVSRGIHPAR